MSEIQTTPLAIEKNKRETRPRKESREAKKLMGQLVSDFEALVEQGKATKSKENDYHRQRVVERFQRNGTNVQLKVVREATERINKEKGHKYLVASKHPSEVVLSRQQNVGTEEQAQNPDNKILLIDAPNQEISQKNGAVESPTTSLYEDFGACTVNTRVMLRREKSRYRVARRLGIHTYSTDASIIADHMFAEAFPGRSETGSKLQRQLFRSTSVSQAKELADKLLQLQPGES